MCQSMNLINVLLKCCEFRRTHLHLDERDPEERLVDVLAGEFGFLRDIVVPHADGSISFDKVERIRSILCPDASLVASLIGITRTWPQPCVLVRAEEGLRKKEQRATAQGCFGFVGCSRDSWLHCSAAWAACKCATWAGEDTCPQRE